MRNPTSCALPTDRTPHLPPAGLAGEDNGETAEKTIKPEFFGKAPPTPPMMRRWRKETEPGKICLHPGVADDRDHERVSTYGRAEPVGVKVHEVLNVAPKSYLIEKAVEKKEAIYLSHKREPLGSAYVRGHVLPGELKREGFGRPTPQDVAGDQSKELLHPTERIVPQVEHALYVKSHANYDPGEQRRRGYSWQSKHGAIDPSLYRFGANVQKGEMEGVAKAMNPSLDESYKRPAVVVEKILEDFREVTSESLGKAKNLGHGDRSLSGNHVFGLPSQRDAEWGVRECIGNYTPEEQQPDKDLGRSVRPGWRNIADDSRLFGVPSIRSDIPAPSLKSVADHQNYGDEAGAETLLYPPRFADEGVTQADFLEARSKDDLGSLFRSAGFDLSDALLADAYARAATLDPKGLVSVQSFRMALNGEA